MLPIVDRAFLNITTSEKKTGFLLIEIFERFFNPKDGHLKRVAILF